MAKIADTLYAKYIKDRIGADVLENEFGFITYKINGDECFIIDMGVSEKLRGGGKGKNLVESLSEIALSHGCKSISANIDLKDPGSKNTQAAAIKSGFRIVRAEYNILLIEKLIKNGGE